jgi:hypothetical protein
MTGVRKYVANRLGIYILEAASGDEVLGLKFQFDSRTTEGDLCGDRGRFIWNKGQVTIGQ